MKSVHQYDLENFVRIIEIVIKIGKNIAEFWSKNPKLITKTVEISLIIIKTTKKLSKMLLKWSQLSQKSI